VTDRAPLRGSRTKQQSHDAILHQNAARDKVIVLGEDPAQESSAPA
jgi:hypothetical protein